MKIPINHNYSITNSGEITNDRTNRVVKQTLTHKGYMVVGLRKGAKFKQYQVHRLVAMTYLPTNDTTLVVNHLDGNKVNNHISNLEWCTQAENIAHAVENGFSTRGTNNCNAKLDDDKVRHIRAEAQAGVLQRTLADRFSVNENTISAIVRHQNWAHVQ